ncbi:putative Non-heme chloroperoxidase [Hypsibius exemplaris]|uniref:Non-heme chloroperoxidase n=1 Tax=Hypsibius exemplaris TaxID=2072580 RepID=A0A1W0XBB4_HYPEX|nr:putative Non-heme chloroperoxidase [Hypsibius exemplaris]
MNTYTDDLFDFFEALDLKNVIVVGHSTGGGELGRLIGRHGCGRISHVVLIGSMTPLILKTSNNPGGLPISVFDALRAGVVKDRSQSYKHLAAPFYGTNRAGVQGSIKGQFGCIKAFSETDFTEDLKKIDRPTLILRGEDNQNVSYRDSALLSAKPVKYSTLKIYPGYPHGMMQIHADEINRDSQVFIRSQYLLIDFLRL